MRAGVRGSTDHLRTPRPVLAPHVTAPIEEAVQTLELLALDRREGWPAVAAAHVSVHQAVVAPAASARVDKAYAR